MVLEDDRFTNRITIIIKDDNGNIINNPIDYTTVHGTYTVHAVDSQTGNSCWSKIYVEDKLPPVIDCPEDVTTSCANNEPLILILDFMIVVILQLQLKKVSDMFHELPLVILMGSLHIENSPIQQKINMETYRLLVSIEFTFKPRIRRCTHASKHRTFLYSNELGYQFKWISDLFRNRNSKLQ